MDVKDFKDDDAYQNNPHEAALDLNNPGKLLLANQSSVLGYCSNTCHVRRQPMPNLFRLWERESKWRGSIRSHSTGPIKSDCKQI